MALGEVAGFPGQRYQVLRNIVTFTGLFLCSALAFSTKGLSPEEEANYSGQTTFACKDSGKVFPIEKLNDDFCDCPDGTDEPGTSACPLGSFYCRNRGHTPLTLPSSRVNDGICDCCDASDEYNGWVKCPKTCAEAGASARKELKDKVEKYRQGLKIREAAVSGAKQQRQQWEARVALLEEETKVLEASETQLREEKEAVEKKEREEREWREKLEKEQEERERLEREGRQKAEGGSESGAGEEPSEDGQQHLETEPDAKDQEDFGDSAIMDSIEEEERLVAELEAAGDLGTASSDDPGQPPEEEATPEEDESPTDGGAALSPEDSLEDDPMQQAEATPGEPDDDDEDLSGLSKEEMGRRIAERWTGHSETENVYKEDGEEEDAAAAAERERDEHLDMEDDEDFGDYHSDHSDHADHEGEGPTDPTPEEEAANPDTAVSPRATWWARMLQWPRDVCSRIYSLVAPFPAPPDLNHTEAARVKKEYNEVYRKLSKSRSELDKLKEKLKLDYGPDGQFIDLVDKCFSLNIQHYVYEVCPFKEVIQKEGHSHTTVGRWTGFEDNYTKMVFKNGDHCWNGPSRSMTVSMECGMKTEIFQVEEPSRCEYSAIMTTPALCTADAAKDFQDELDRREQELASIHDEL